MAIRWFCTCLFVTLLVMLVTEATQQACRHLNVVILGRSGAGKSSLINFMIHNGTEVAREGEFAAITRNVTFYNITEFHMMLADSPGLFDTTGYSNEEITQLVKSSIITQSNHSVSGVVLMFNAESVKFYLQDIMKGALHIFGEEALQNLLFVFNRNDKLNAARQKSISIYLAATLQPVFARFGHSKFDFEAHTVFIDTKGDFHRYAHELHAKMSQIFTGDGIDIVAQDQKLQAEIEAYFQMELQDEANWKSWVDKEYHAENRTREYSFDTFEPETYVVCEEECDEFLFIDYNCEDECVERTRYKPVTKTIKEPYLYEWYEDVSRRELKYTEQELRAKAAQKVADEIHQKVHASFSARTSAKL